MENRLSDRRSAIRPVENTRKRQDALFYCDECLKSVTKDNCDCLYSCKKCFTKICEDCYIYSERCDKCSLNLTKYQKKEEIKIPENMSHFIQIKQPIKKWYRFYIC